MSGAECVVACKAWLGEGPLWSPHEGCLYWTDVPSYTVCRWNPSTGEQVTWKMPEMVASMAVRAKGGLILATTGGIDEEGFIWNARWGGGCLIRWAPDGTIDRTVKIPSQLVTSATFGGEDLDVLYVTTARYMVSEQDLREQPQSGGIFALDPGVKGIPEVPFAG